MLKKSLSALLCIVMLVSIFSFGSLAVAPRADEGNACAVVLTHRYAGDGCDSCYQVSLIIANTANTLIELRVQLAIAVDRFSDIDKLIADTNAISAAAIQSIRSLGFEAECVYVPYIINGQTVYIDPIRVIKLP